MMQAELVNQHTVCNGLAATYYSNNRNRMDYIHFRNQGYLIGSGTIESGCKQIGTMRMKRSSAQWDRKWSKVSRKSTGVLVE